MSEEFQGGVCGGSSSWWINPSTNIFRSSPCASAINDPGSFGWLSHNQSTIDPKTTRSGSDDSGGGGSAVSDGSGSVVLIDDGSNWNPNFLHDNNNNTGKSNQNYSNHMLQHKANSGIDSSMNINNCYGHNSFHHLFNSHNNSSLFQTLFDADSQPDHLRQPLSDNNNNNNIQSKNYLSRPDYLNPAGFCPSFNKLECKTDNNHLQFTNNTTPIFLPSSQLQSVLQSKPNLNGLHTKKNNQESKKVSNKPLLKRPRMETPSPLPTFKVRKEKMGDRITALQQLVSPFGKTDTASVLHEAIEYIKFLHDQVGVLTPYLKNGSTKLQHQHQQNNVKGETHDLQSRGLCLVPISSTFPIAAETATDFWTPNNFGGCLR